MLVLGRRKDEWIRIGDNIRIVVIRAGDKVRLGIEAPKGVPVVRGELDGDGSQVETGAGDTKAVRN